MADKRYEAEFENRTYYFFLLQKAEKELTVELYRTNYKLVKTDKGWRNHNANRFNLIDGLILSIISVLQQDGLIAG